MQRLLSIVLHKIRYQKASKRLLFIYFLLLIGTPILLGVGDINVNGIKIEIRSLEMLQFPYIWHFYTFICSWFKFLLLMVVVSIITMEYSDNTLKQNLIDGLSKKEFIASKFYMVLLFVGVSTVFVAVSAFILGLCVSDYTAAKIIFKEVDYLVAFFVELMGFFSFGLFLSILIRRSGFVIGTVMIWYIAENIALVVLRKIYHFNTDTLSYFLPLKAMGLIKEPFTRTSMARQAINQMQMNVSNDYSVQWDFVLAAVAWSVLLIFASYKILQKRDL